MTRRSCRSGVTRIAMALAGVLVSACALATPQSGGAVSTPPTAHVTTPPSPTAAEAASRAFTSGFYGFEVDLPSGWVGRAASTPWVTGVLGDRCPLDWDCFSDTTEDRTLAVAAFDVSETTTLDDWHAAMNRSTPSFCTDSDPPNETTLDGERALIWTAACESEGLNVIKLAALRGTSAYMFLFVSPTTQRLEANRATFDSIMSTFHFADR